MPVISRQGFIDIRLLTFTVNEPICLHYLLRRFPHSLEPTPLFIAREVEARCLRLPLDTITIDQFNIIGNDSILNPNVTTTTKKSSSILNTLLGDDGIWAQHEELKALKKLGIFSSRAPKVSLITPQTVIRLLRNFNQTKIALVFEAVIISLMAEQRLLKQLLLTLKSAVFQYSNHYNISVQNTISTNMLQSYLLSQCNNTAYPPLWSGYYQPTNSTSTTSTMMSSSNSALVQTANGNNQAGQRAPVSDMKTAYLLLTILQNPKKQEITSLWNSLIAVQQLPLILKKNNNDDDDSMNDTTTTTTTTMTTTPTTTTTTAPRQKMIKGQQITPDSTDFSTIPLTNTNSSLSKVIPPRKTNSTIVRGPIYIKSQENDKKRKMFESFSSILNDSNGQLSDLGQSTTSLGDSTSLLSSFVDNNGVQFFPQTTLPTTLNSSPYNTQLAPDFLIDQTFSTPTELATISQFTLTQDQQLIQFQQPQILTTTGILHDINPNREGIITHLQNELYKPKVPPQTNSLLLPPPVSLSTQQQQQQQQQQQNNNPFQNAFLKVNIDTTVAQLNNDCNKATEITLSYLSNANNNTNTNSSQSLTNTNNTTTTHIKPTKSQKSIIKFILQNVPPTQHYQNVSNPIQPWDPSFQQPTTLHPYHTKPSAQDLITGFTNLSPTQKQITTFMLFPTQRILPSMALTTLYPFIQFTLKPTLLPLLPLYFIPALNHQFNYDLYNLQYPQHFLTRYSIPSTSSFNRAYTVYIADENEQQQQTSTIPNQFIFTNPAYGLNRKVHEAMHLALSNNKNNQLDLSTVASVVQNITNKDNNNNNNNNKDHPTSYEMIKNLPGELFLPTRPTTTCQTCLFNYDRYITQYRAKYSVKNPLHNTLMSHPQFQLAQQLFQYKLGCICEPPIPDMNPFHRLPLSVYSSHPHIFPQYQQQKSPLLLQSSTSVVELTQSTMEDNNYSSTTSTGSNNKKKDYNKLIMGNSGHANTVMGDSGYHHSDMSSLSLDPTQQPSDLSSSYSLYTLDTNTNLQYPQQQQRSSSPNSTTSSITPTVINQLTSDQIQSPDDYFNQQPSTPSSSSTTTPSQSINSTTMGNNNTTNNTQQFGRVGDPTFRSFPGVVPFPTLFSLALLYQRHNTLPDATKGIKKGKKDENEPIEINDDDFYNPNNILTPQDLYSHTTNLVSTFKWLLSTLHSPIIYTTSLIEFDEETQLSFFTGSSKDAKKPPYDLYLYPDEYAPISNLDIPQPIYDYTFQQQQLPLDPTKYSSHELLQQYQNKQLSRSSANSMNDDNNNNNNNNNTIDNIVDQLDGSNGARVDLQPLFLRPSRLVDGICEDFNLLYSDKIRVEHAVPTTQCSVSYVSILNQNTILRPNGTATDLFTTQQVVSKQPKSLQKQTKTQHMNLLHTLAPYLPHDDDITEEEVDNDNDDDTITMTTTTTTTTTTKINKTKGTTTSTTSSSSTTSSTSNPDSLPFPYPITQETLPLFRSLLFHIETLPFDQRLRLWRYANLAIPLLPEDKFVQDIPLFTNVPLLSADFDAIKEEFNRNIVRRQQYQLSLGLQATLLQDDELRNLILGCTNAQELAAILSERFIQGSSTPISSTNASKQKKGRIGGGKSTTGGGKSTTTTKSTSTTMGDNDNDLLNSQSVVQLEPLTTEQLQEQRELAEKILNKSGRGRKSMLHHFLNGSTPQWAKKKLELFHHLVGVSGTLSTDEQTGNTTSNGTTSGNNNSGMGDSQTNIETTTTTTTKNKGKKGSKKATTATTTTTTNEMNNDTVTTRAKRNEYNPLQPPTTLFGQSSIPQQQSPQQSQQQLSSQQHYQSLPSLPQPSQNIDINNIPMVQIPLNPDPSSSYSTYYFNPTVQQGLGTSNDVYNIDDLADEHLFVATNSDSLLFPTHNRVSSTRPQQQRQQTPQQIQQQQTTPPIQSSPLTTSGPQFGLNHSSTMFSSYQSLGQPQIVDTNTNHHAEIDDLFFNSNPGLPLHLPSTTTTTTTSTTNTTTGQQQSKYFKNKQPSVIPTTTTTTTPLQPQSLYLNTSITNQLPIQSQSSITTVTKQHTTQSFFQESLMNSITTSSLAINDPLLNPKQEQPHSNLVSSNDDLFIDNMLFSSSASLYNSPAIQKQQSTTLSTTLGQNPIVHDAFSNNSDEYITTTNEFFDSTSEFNTGHRYAPMPEATIKTQTTEGFLAQDYHVMQNYFETTPQFFSDSNSLFASNDRLPAARRNHPNNNPLLGSGLIEDHQLQQQIMQEQQQHQQLLQQQQQQQQQQPQSGFQQSQNLAFSGSDLLPKHHEKK